MVAVGPEIHTEHTNILCGQNVEFLEVISGGTQRNHCSLKG
jgi:hypothetical protein